MAKRSSRFIRWLAWGNFAWVMLLAINWNTWLHHVLAHRWGEEAAILAYGGGLLGPMTIVGWIVLAWVKRLDL